MRSRTQALFRALACLALGLTWPSHLWAGEMVLSAPWGVQEGALGLLDQPEMERGGPLSFCVSDAGVFILDTVNRRLVRSEPGGNLKTLASQVLGWAICPDGAEGCFVIAERQVLHYDGKGFSKERFSLSPGARIIEGYGCEISLSQPSGIAYTSVEQKTYPVATGSAAAGFQAIRPQSAMAQQGRLGREPENLAFSIKRLNAGDVRILGRDEDGKELVSVPLQVDGALAGAVLFKGQDSQGRLYVELERLIGGRAELEVHCYSITGERLARHQLPNDYYTTVYKKTEVTPDGKVYQMLTTPEGVEIVRY